MANAKRNFGDYNGAIESYEKAVALNPNHMYAYMNMGRVKKDIKDYKGALEDFKKALFLDPQNVNIQNDIKNLEETINKENTENPADSERK